MMIKKYRILFCILFLLIGGCSSGEDSSTIEPSSNENILNDQMQALEKAKQVEQMVQDAFEKQRRLIDENSQ